METSWSDSRSSHMFSMRWWLRLFIVYTAAASASLRSITTECLWCFPKPAFLTSSPNSWITESSHIVGTLKVNFTVFDSQWLSCRMLQIYEAVYSYICVRKSKYHVFTSSWAPTLSSGLFRNVSSKNFSSRYSLKRSSTLIPGSRFSGEHENPHEVMPLLPAR